MRIENFLICALELYQSTNYNEFFKEVVALLAENYRTMEHSLLLCEEEWEILGSTLEDYDEVNFLLKEAKEKYIKDNTRIVLDKRKSVGSIKVMPMKFRNGQISGMWILESNSLRFPKLNQKELDSVNMIITSFIDLFLYEKASLKNLYLEPDFKLPGEYQFEKVLNSLSNIKEETCICVIRYEKYRSELRKNGSKSVHKELEDVFVRLKKMNTGKLYRLAYDTFAVISLQGKSEIYACMDKFMSDQQNRSEINIAIFKYTSGADIKKKIEDILASTESGILEKCSPKEFIVEEFNVEVKSSDKEKGIPSDLLEWMGG